MRKTKANKRENKRGSKRRTQRKLSRKLIKGGVDESNYFQKWFIDKIIPALPSNNSWKLLSRNPSVRAIEYLEKNQEKIDWDELSYNPSAIRLLEANQEKINWVGLSANPNAIPLLEANQDKINWYMLSANPNAIPLLEANPGKIDWNILSKNPNAIPLLKANQYKIDYASLSENTNVDSLYESNPTIYEQMVQVHEEEPLFEEVNMNEGAMKILKDHPEKIDWAALSFNTSADAISLLESNKERIDWNNLSANKSAIHLLLSQPNKIDWGSLCMNSNIDKIIKQLPDEVDKHKNELIDNIMFLFINPGIFVKRDLNAIRNFHKTLFSATENASPEKAKIYQRTKVGQVLKNPDLNKEIVGFL